MSKNKCIKRDRDIVKIEHHEAAIISKFNQINEDLCEILDRVSSDKEGYVHVSVDYCECSHVILGLRVTMKDGSVITIDDRDMILRYAEGAFLLDCVIPRNEGEDHDRSKPEGQC